MYKYLSVCSGIEAFSVAVADLDFEPVAFSEIEKFPSAVLAHRYPSVPNLGDMTKIDPTKLGQIDWLVGGTPCQSFSFAGLREGLNDDRGNLTLEFVRLAHKLRDGNGLRGLLWENVPGVLSDKTNAFGCLLGSLVGHDGPLATPRGERWPDLGMVAGPRARCAWRILNSQYFGVPQRRRRVFLVADFGNSFDPAAVLFEPGGQGWRAEASGEAGEDTAGTISARTKGGGGLGTDMDLADGLKVYGGNAEGGNAEYPMLTKSNIGKGIHNQAPLVMAFSSKDHGADVGSLSPTLRASGHSGSHANAGAPPAIAFQSQASSSQSMRADEISPMLDKSKVVAVAFDTTQITSKANGSNPQFGDPSHPLATGARAPAIAIQAGALRQNPNSGPDGMGASAELAYTVEARAEVQAVAFALRGREDGAEVELGNDQANALRKSPGSAYSSGVVSTTQVRRLTPVECERLQGFPDNYTLIPGLPGWRDVGDDENPDDLTSQGLTVKLSKNGQLRVNDPDGPRYKALGNSFTTEPVNWIMSRAQASLRGKKMPGWQPMRKWG